MERTDIIKIVPNDEALFIALSDAYIFYDFLMALPEKGRMVEIGTGVGHSTVFFSLVKPKWTIYTIDGYGLFGEGSIYPYDPVDENRFVNSPDLKSNLNKFEYDASNNVIQIIQNSCKIPWELPVDAIYIDGDHTYQGCRDDFYKYSPFLKPGGCIFIDDYFREDFGVRRVVDELCEQGWKAKKGVKAVTLIKI